MIVIITFTDSLLFATNANRTLSTLSSYSIMLLAVLLLFATLLKGLKLYSYDMYAIGCMLIIALIMVLRSGGELNYKSFILQISLLLFGLAFAKIYTYRDFCDYYVNIMAVLALVSLVTFAFGALIVKMSFLPTITNTVGNQFVTLLLSNVPFYSQSRNWGLFREPGVYQFFLNFAFILSLFAFSKKKLFHISVFILALLTTMSGAALLPMILTLFAFYLDGIKPKTSPKKYGSTAKKYIVPVCFALIIVALLTGYFNEIIEKMTGEASTQSIQIRLSSLHSMIVSFAKNPLVGIPFEEQKQIALNITQQYASVNYIGTTNTIPAFFANFGIIVGLFYVIGLWKFCARLSKKKLTVMLLFLSILVSTSNENLTASLLISVIPFFGFQRTQNDCLPCTQ